MSNLWIIPAVISGVWCVFWLWCALVACRGGHWGDAIGRAMSWAAIFVGTAAIWTLYGVARFIMWTLA